MNAKKFISILLSAMLILSIATSVFADGVYYLPDVTEDMSLSSYWSCDETYLMTYEEIERLNEETIATKETCMYDLKNMPDTVDGIALNEALIKSSEADANYYLGWTYLESEEKATQEDYDKIIENTQNPDPQEEQEVLYGIAVKRTELRTFPTEVAIWDDLNDKDFDYQYLCPIRVNEPVVITSVSNDGKFYLAKNICCSGWIPVENVAICKDKNQWLGSWDIDNEDVLVVWGDKLFCEKSISGAETSELMLTMGTTLKLAKNFDPNTLTDNRGAYNNYAVWIPVRNEDGSFDEKLTLISQHHKVSKGYLPLTEKNISKVALSALGNTYGWGGSLNSEDCSGYMRNVYKCFGMELARNTTWQSYMPMARVDMQYMCREERVKFMESLPFGTILYFNGHEMMYLGAVEGKYYVISAVGTLVIPGEPPIKQRIRGTVINTLDIQRANGNTWLDELTVAIVPYWHSEDNELVEYEWYHEGVGYCLKNKIMKGDEDKLFNPDDDIIWAEFLQIIYNLTPDANDLNQENWYDNAVSYARDNNLIYEEEADFDPEEAITREELVSVLYRYALSKNEEITAEEDVLSAFSDGSEISEHIIPAMAYAVENKIINGKTADKIKPCDNATRAEIAVIMQRYLSSEEIK